MVTVHCEDSKTERARAQRGKEDRGAQKGLQPGYGGQASLGSRLWTLSEESPCPLPLSSPDIPPPFNGPPLLFAKVASVESEFPNLYK